MADAAPPDPLIPEPVPIGPYQPDRDKQALTQTPERFLVAKPVPAFAESAPGERRFFWRRRFFWPGGLSARLLLLTVAIVVLANLLILPTNLAAFEERWLLDRLRAAELASLVEETAPGGVVTEHVSERLLASAGVVSVLSLIHI